MSEPVSKEVPTERTERDPELPPNFVEDLVREQVAQGRHGGRVVTRFPPEPNGYLHIGHAKSIFLNFGLAQKFGGQCNLRFDDTNPETEEASYVRAIKKDIEWLLGAKPWGENEFYASDYFPKLYDFAVQMIKDGKAYVDSRSTEEIRDTRGDYYKPGVEAPDRARSVEENLALFEKMKSGALPDGSHVLRAKGDMASTDVKMRDPVMYRIRHAHHHRTGDAWCIYPLYDWAHGQSDYVEGITHSICTLEFVNHRPLYDWFLDQVGAPREDRPEQTEFAKLNFTYTVLSKRRLLELVQRKHVEDWDDPRMPTLSGLRRRGVTPEALRAVCERVGVSTRDSVVDISLLEHAIREDLNATSPRVMAVLRPLKVTLRNFPEGETIEFDAPFDPEKPDGPTRKVALSRVLYIEQEDFMEVPPKKFFRLAPGQEVRLRYACIIKCVEVKKAADGTIEELVCEWDPASRGGTAADGRKIKGTLHWVSASHAVDAHVRLYDRLFLVENPLKDKDTYLEHLNPHSLEALSGCKLEPSLAAAKPGQRVQFERLGYFCEDKDLKDGMRVWNRTITLKDAWAKVAGKE